jgi:hypothetical protein
VSAMLVYNLDYCPKTYKLVSNDDYRFRRQCFKVSSAIEDGIKKGIFTPTTQVNVNLDIDLHDINFKAGFVTF